MAATNIQSFSGDVEVSSNLTVDTNTLHVDSVAGRVGVGKTDPAYTVDVNGILNATSLYLGGSEFTGGGFDETADPVAIGTIAGASAQGTRSVAVGYSAGNTSQSSNSTAVGAYAGRLNQGSANAAIGYGAAESNQSAYSAAVGAYAGQSAQGGGSTAIGGQAAQNSQAGYAVAVGFNAGRYNQATNAVVVGVSAAETSQGIGGIAVGQAAGQSNQGSFALAAGYTCGRLNQGTKTVAVGWSAGYCNQSSHSVAIGTNAGYVSQGVESTAIGMDAGYNLQGKESVAIGHKAAYNSQSSFAVAVGWTAATDYQGRYAVAMGWKAGSYQQKDFSVAIGANTGTTSQGPLGIAIGYYTGAHNQGTYGLAMGHNTGTTSQGDYAVALGLQASISAQGSFAIALGANAAQYNQPTRSFYVSTSSVRNAGGTYYMRYNTSTGEVSYTSSDDRVKDGETLITGAVKTLSKLRPQNYFKRMKLDPYAPEQNWCIESGLMAQEVYYSAPELRHMVGVPDDAGDIENYTPPPSDDPAQDPDYSMWGTGIATVDYMQMVPYLVKGVQEIVTELPRSKTTVSNAWGQNIMGLVVSANENAHKTNTTPIVALSNVYMDKKWYGVVSDKTTDTNDYDTLVDTKGDTLIWVTDVGGPLESGDLVTTSNVAPGYAQKQGDDFIRSSTVAKVTQDCDFTEPTQRAIRVPKQELSNVTYYRHDASYEIGIDKYEKIPSFKTRVDETTIYFKEIGDGEEEGGQIKYYHGENEVDIIKYDKLPENERSKKVIVEIEPVKYEKLDDEEKALYSLGTKKTYFMLKYSYSKTPIPQHDEEVVIQEMADVLDENGQIVWEETANTVPEYILVDHGSYKAALVSAKLI